MNYDPAIGQHESSMKTKVNGKKTEDRGVEVLYVATKERNQGLCQSITEHKLGSHDNDLKGKMHISVKQNRAFFVLRTLGVNPLKSAVIPSFFIRSLITTEPDTLCSKLAFCIRVLTVSRGAATVIDATAPAMEAMKFCDHVAFE